MFKRKKKPQFDIPRTPEKIVNPLKNPNIKWTGDLAFITSSLVVISRSVHDGVFVFSYPWRWFNVDDDATMNTFIDDAIMSVLCFFGWFSVTKASRRWIILSWAYGWFSMFYQVWCHYNLKKKTVYLWTPPDCVATYMDLSRIFLASVMGVNQFFWSLYVFTFKTPF